MSKGRFPPAFGPKSDTIKSTIMTNNHPLLLNAEDIEREGIMVLDDVRSMPVYGEAFISPYLVVALNVMGWVKAELDMRPVHFEQHDLAIVHPKRYTAMALSPIMTHKL